MMRGVNLRNFPIHDLESVEGQAFLHQCRERLKRDGSLALPGFLSDDVLPAMAQEAETGAEGSRPFEHHFQFGTGKSDETYDVDDLADDDPRRFLSRTALTFVGEHLIPDSSFLRELYNWPPMMEFIAQVLQLPQLYRRNDRLSGVNYTVMNEGDEQSWHYDEAHFITTILLQSSEGGGAFEYVRNLRDDSEDDLKGVKMALAGTHPNQISLKVEPGTLLLFEGRYAFHRATPIEGKRRRCLALLAFDQQPGNTINDDLAEVFYGRRVSDAA